MTTVLITGANRGIGLAVARAYRARGVDLVVTARRPEAATDLAALGKGGKGAFDILPLDVADAASVGAFGAALAGRTIDLAIINSGVSGPRGGYADAGNTAEAWASIFAVNVAGAFLSARAVLPCISPGGKLALISSVMGSAANASGASYPYRASKAAVANVGANLAVELKPRNIAVGIYHPGWVRTDMGGPTASISPEESAAGLIARFERLSLATTGIFEDYAGSRITF